MKRIRKEEKGAKRKGKGEKRKEQRERGKEKRERRKEKEKGERKEKSISSYDSIYPERRNYLKNVFFQVKESSKLFHQRLQYNDMDNRS
jgi:hypothetical protein